MHPIRCCQYLIGSYYTQRGFMSHIGERMQQVLNEHKMSLKQASEYAEIPYRSLQNYVSGKQLPGADALVRFHKALNVDLNWLLTGDGLQELEAPSSIGLNEELLQQIIEGVESLLNKKRKVLPLDKKTKIIVMLYKTASIQQNLDPETIRQLIEIAA